MSLRRLHRLFHHKHFDACLAGHPFEAELVEQNLLERFGIAPLPIHLIQFEIDVETVGEPGWSTTGIPR